MIYKYGSQKIDIDDIEGVIDALKSDFITQGPEVDEFERAMAGYSGARYCVVVSSGTAALHLACVASGLNAGHIGWTSPISFVASANCICYVSGDVDFVDIDSGSFNMSIIKLREKFKKASKENRLPKVLIPVHFAGQPCDMKEIYQIASSYGCNVIEDGCHALGARYDDFPVGACKYSAATVFSLHPVKSITAGEGGVILTNDKDLYEKAKCLRSHGLVRGGINGDGLPWYVQMADLGFNYRITDIQCALAKSQLNKLDSFIEKRTILANRYKENLSGIPAIFQTPLDGAVSAWHLMVILFDFENDNHKKEFYYFLKDKGINLTLHYFPIHLNPYYRERFGFKDGTFAASERFYKMAFSFPLYVDLKEEDVDYICSVIRSYFK